MAQVRGSTGESRSTDPIRMLVSVVSIGNLKGIRISKAILEQCNIREPVNDAPRRDWDEAYRQMAENQDDSLLIPESLDIDSSEWEW